MKAMKLWMATIALVLSGMVAITSCNSQKADTDDASAMDTIAPILEQDTTYEQAINRYLVDSIANNYSSGQVSIPSVVIIGVDESNAEDILAWGDYWVFNYNVSGDTLKTQSGGNHPGLMHLKKVGNEFEVTRFERVVDGAGNEASAKKIFGDRYEKFHTVNSDSDAKEEARKEDIATYVKESGLKVTMYQDFGWAPIKL